MELGENGHSKLLHMKLSFGFLFSSGSTIFEPTNDTDWIDLLLPFPIRFGDPFLYPFSPWQMVGQELEIAHRIIGKGFKFS